MSNEILQGAPIGQPKIKPPSSVVGVKSGITLTCNTDQMDANPPPSYTIWTKVFEAHPCALAVNVI